MQRWCLLFVFFSAVLFGVVPVTAADDPLPVVVIGAVVDGPSDRLQAFADGIWSELDVLAEGEFDLRRPAELQVMGDWSLEAARRGLDRLLAEPEVDLVVAVGPISGWVASRRSVFPKPVIVPLAIDAEIQGFPLRGGSSGVPNFNYVAISAPVRRDLTVLQRIVPVRRLAVLLSQALYDDLPHLSERAFEPIMELGIGAVNIPVGESVDAAVAAIPDDIDAVYVLPLPQFDFADIERLAELLITRRLPSFSYSGRLEVDAGLLAALRAEEFWTRLMRRVALNIQRVLLGEDAGTIPVSFPERPRLSLNMRTARAVEVYPSWDVMAEADLLNEEEDGTETLGLTEVVERAVRSNLELAAFDREVAAGAQDVEEARAQLMPQVDLSLLGTLIDDDRAAASFGSQAERTLRASLGLEQALYVEPALANLAIQTRLQTGREHEREQLRLDIALEAATAYLNVLRSQALLEVRRENLRVTRSNLELAEIRVRIGSGGASEVYRWESAIATSRRELVAAERQVDVAKVAVNRITHRPQGHDFSPRHVDLQSPVFMTSDPRFFRYVYSPLSYDTFIAFMVDEGIALSVELAQLDEAIAAARRSLRSARRTRFVPRIALRGELARVLEEGGAGSSNTGAGLPFEIPAADDTDWSLGLTAALPLYSGGAEAAAAARAREVLFQLQTERQAVAERVEQRIRTGLHITGASYYTIELTQDAATAAAKSFELVTDAYARGAVSITELLDAQNAALSANFAASNAVHDFLIDMLGVERATNTFGFFRSAAEREDRLRRLHVFFTERGVAALPIEDGGGE